MTVARSQPYVPLDEFLEMEPPPAGHLEWSAGLVYARSRGSAEHGAIVARLVRLLARGVAAETTILDNAAVWVGPAQFHGRADVAVVRDALHTHRVTWKGRVLGEAVANPEVIVNVFSPSTAELDRGAKFEVCRQSPALQEYVLVAQNERVVEVRRRDRRGWSADVVSGGGMVRIHGLEIAVDDIYR